MSSRNSHRKTDTRTVVCSGPAPASKPLPVDEAIALPSGTMLGRYRIEEELGQGQAGVVYRAFDTAIERVVAIKCLRTPTKSGPGRTHSRRSVQFEEAKVIGQLNHPHITAVFDMGKADNLSYIVMEYVQGETLKARLAQMQTDPASVPQALNFIVMVARALHY